MSWGGIRITSISSPQAVPAKHKEDVFFTFMGPGMVIVVDSYHAKGALFVQN